LEAEASVARHDCKSLKYQVRDSANEARQWRNASDSVKNESLGLPGTILQVVRVQLNRCVPMPFAEKDDSTADT